MNQKRSEKRGRRVPKPPVPPLSYREQRCPVCGRGMIKNVQRNGIMQRKCSEPGCANS